MGLIARLLSFTRAERNGAKVSDVKVDAGGENTATAEHFAPAGDDSHPLPDDYVVSVRTGTRTGNETAVGYLDPANESKAQPGEKRIYARDEGGVQVVEVWLKSDGAAAVTNDTASFTVSPDGSIKGSNGSGSFELQASGNFLVNGVTIDTSGNITSPASVSAPSIKADGKELAGHDHPAGTPPGNTGPNN